MSHEKRSRTPEEVSAACRRASLSRKHFGGGRPKGWRKHQGSMPSRTISIDGGDWLILRRCATIKGLSMRELVNTLAACIVLGGEIKAYPKCAPDGWQWWRKR